MEGLEAAEITFGILKESASTFRIDADYFRKVYLEHEKTIHRNPERFTTFEGLGLEIDGSAFYPSIEPFYGSGDLPFLRVADVDSVIDFETGTTIPAELCDRFPTLKKIGKGDIVLTKGGSVARIGLVTEDAAACRDLIFVNSSKLPERDYTFLCFSLQTKFANDLLVRSSSQTAQPHLTLTLVRDIPLFWPSEALREKVLEVVQQSYMYRSIAMTSYFQAETLLLRELGLEDWQPPEPLAYESTFQQAWGDGRLDAEHFQPKYQAFFDHTRKTAQSKNWPIKKLGELSDQLKYGSSTELNYIEAGVPFLRIADLSNKEFDAEKLKYISKEASDQERTASVNTQDVLISRSGTLGLAVSIPKHLDGAIFGSYFIRLRPDQNIIDSIFLALYLNSLPGQLQVEWLNTGGIQTNLTIPAIESIEIAVPSLPEQEKLVAIVLKSQATRQQAKGALELAKRAVEVAIEDSEEAALALLAAG